MDFSVVIPAYNSARELPRALDSVLGQTCPPSEIVVVDDGSTDDTAEVVGPYVGRVRYIPTPHRGLPAAARNRGIAETRAEYVALLDADDWWYPRHLECAGEAMARRPSAGLCYGDFEMVDKQGRSIRKVRTLVAEENAYAALAMYDFICTSTTVVRRACLEQLGVFSESEDYAGCEDWELWLRIARHHPLAHVPEVLVAYQFNFADGSLASSDRWLASFEAMSCLILQQVDGRQKLRVAGSHDYIRARWHLARGHIDEARSWMNRSIGTWRALDRRWMFWLLTRGRWSRRLPTSLRRRLEIATRSRGQWTR